MWSITEVTGLSLLAFGWAKAMACLAAGSHVVLLLKSLKSLKKLSSKKLVNIILPMMFVQFHETDRHFNPE